MTAHTETDSRTIIDNASFDHAEKKKGRLKNKMPENWEFLAKPHKHAPSRQSGTVKDARNVQTLSRYKKRFISTTEHKTSAPRRILRRRRKRRQCGRREMRGRAAPSVPVVRGRGRNLAGLSVERGKVCNRRLANDERSVASLLLVHRRCPERRRWKEVGPARAIVLPTRPARSFRLRATVVMPTHKRRWRWLRCRESRRLVAAWSRRHGAMRRAPMRSIT